MFEDEEHISEAYWSYFMELLFTTSSPTNSDIAMCTKVIVPKVTEELNARLTSDYTREEVAEALEQMGTLKSPGPNWFGTCFYQNHRKTIGDDVCKATLSLLQGEGVTLLLTQLL